MNKKYGDVHNEDGMVQVHLAALAVWVVEDAAVVVRKRIRHIDCNGNGPDGRNGNLKSGFISLLHLFVPGASTRNVLMKKRHRGDTEWQRKDFAITHLAVEMTGAVACRVRVRLFRVLVAKE